MMNPPPGSKADEAKNGFDSHIGLGSRANYSARRAFRSPKNLGSFENLHELTRLSNRLAGPRGGKRQLDLFGSARRAARLLAGFSENFLLATQIGFHHLGVIEGER